MFSHTVLVALTALLSLNNQFILQAAASPCVVFDSDFNLLALGLGGKDFNLGKQSTWSSSGAATDITASGRPPFDGTGTTCYLSQFFNAIYVLNGDNSNPNNVGIYDATAKSWTTQQVKSDATGGASFSTSAFNAILDHDTNVFYALSGGSVFFLDFGQLKAANATPIPWTAVGTPSFSTTNYNPVMALAQNHIHFLDVPGAQPGTAQIFVIHFSFFQPTAQAYPINGSSDNFPETHGQTASFFQPTPGVQQEFAFIPDDGSKTYVINVESNTTAALTGPTDKSASTYAAGITSLVQLTSAGNIFFLPYTQGQASTSAAATWTKVSLSGLPAAGSSSNSSSASPSGTGKGGSSSAKPTGTGTGAAAGATGSSAAAASFSSVNMLRSLGVAGLLAVVAIAL